MAHRPRKEMIAETRAKLIAAGREAFGTIGYNDASMDDFTAAAGLTRGALYHHFGDKKGLMAAVVAQIDAEMSDRLNQLSAQAPTRWQGLIDDNVGYLKMAIEPEIQRIMLRDGPAVLGTPRPGRAPRVVSRRSPRASRRCRRKARSPPIWTARPSPG